MIKNVTEFNEIVRVFYSKVKACETNGKLSDRELKSTVSTIGVCDDLAYAIKVAESRKAVENNLELSEGDIQRAKASMTFMMKIFMYKNGCCDLSVMREYSVTFMFVMEESWAKYTADDLKKKGSISDYFKGKTEVIVNKEIDRKPVNFKVVD